eukprot:scaffold2926_cov247-Pinguiococcus_pyrenoidosus.AAC.8
MSRGCIRCRSVDHVLPIHLERFAVLASTLEQRLLRGQGLLQVARPALQARPLPCMKLLELRRRLPLVKHRCEAVTRLVHQELEVAADAHEAFPLGGRIGLHAQASEVEGSSTLLAAYGGSVHRPPADAAACHVAAHHTNVLGDVDGQMAAVGKHLLQILRSFAVLVRVCATEGEQPLSTGRKLARKRRRFGDADFRPLASVHKRFELLVENRRAAVRSIGREHDASLLHELLRLIDLSSKLHRLGGHLLHREGPRKQLSRLRQVQAPLRIARKLVLALPVFHPLEKQGSPGDERNIDGERMSDRAPKQALRLVRTGVCGQEDFVVLDIFDKQVRASVR